MARAGHPIRIGTGKGSPGLRRGPRKQIHVIYARFYLPAMPCAGEPSEVRIVNLHSHLDRDWIHDMTTNYAFLGEYGLTTFFPDHP